MCACVARCCGYFGFESQIYYKLLLATIINGYLKFIVVVAPCRMAFFLFVHIFFVVALVIAVVVI